MMNESDTNSLSLRIYSDFRKFFKVSVIITLIAAAALTIYMSVDYFRANYVATTLLNKAITNSAKIQPSFFYKDILGEREEIQVKVIDGTKTYILIKKENKSALFLHSDSRTLDHVAGDACSYAYPTIENNKVIKLTCDNDIYLKIHNQKR